MSTVAKVKAWR